MALCSWQSTELKPASFRLRPSHKAGMFPVSRHRTRRAAGRKPASSSSCVVQGRGPADRALQLCRLYRIKWWFNHLEYNVAVSLLITTLIRNMLVRPCPCLSRS